MGKDNIESLKKILIKIIEEQDKNSLSKEIIELFESYLKEDNINSIEINYLLLNIIYVLKYSHILNIPLVLTAKELEEKIIRSTINKLINSNNEKKDNECVQSLSTKQEAIKNYLQGKTFIPVNNNFKLPEPHTTGNLQIYDDWNGENFKAEVEIDSNGRIVKFLKDPTMIVKDTRSFEEIYGGLLNDILNFEEE